MLQAPWELLTSHETPVDVDAELANSTQHYSMSSSSSSSGDVDLLHTLYRFCTDRVLEVRRSGARFQINVEDMRNQIACFFHLRWGPLTTGGGGVQRRRSRRAARPPDNQFQVITVTSSSASTSRRRVPRNMTRISARSPRPWLSADISTTRMAYLSPTVSPRDGRTPASNTH